MRLTNHTSVIIGIMLPVVLIISANPGVTGILPSNHNNSKNVITITSLAPGQKYSGKNDKMGEVPKDKRGEPQYELWRELNEKYTNVFNRLLGQCSDWQPSLGSPKSIDTLCGNLVEKMNLAGTELIKQDQLIDKMRAEDEPPRSPWVQEIPGPPEAPVRPHRKRVAVPMDAATLQKNEVRIEKEIKLQDLFQAVGDNALNRVLGNCGESIHRRPANPKSSESVCEELMQKFKTTGNIMLEQGELVEKLEDELPVAARKDVPPRCEGFYLPSGTFITLPDCPPGRVP